MICPACKSDMIVVEHSRIELDYCPKCQGAWFDSDELELLLRSSGLESRSLFTGSVLASPEAKTSEKKRKCPICSSKMRKVTIGQQPGILIDLCPRGNGLYLDGGELSRLTAQLAERTPEAQSSQQQLISFVGEVFKATGKRVG